MTDIPQKTRTAGALGDISRENRPLKCSDEQSFTEGVRMTERQIDLQRVANLRVRSANLDRKRSEA